MRQKINDYSIDTGGGFGKTEEIQCTEPCLPTTNVDAQFSMNIQESLLHGEHKLKVYVKVKETANNDHGMFYAFGF